VVQNPERTFCSGTESPKPPAHTGWGLCFSPRANFIYRESLSATVIHYRQPSPPPSGGPVPCTTTTNPLAPPHPPSQSVGRGFPALRFPVRRMALGAVGLLRSWVVVEAHFAQQHVSTVHSPHVEPSQNVSVMRKAPADRRSARCAGPFIYRVRVIFLNGFRSGQESGQVAISRTGCEVACHITNLSVTADSHNLMIRSF